MILINDMQSLITINLNKQLTTPVYGWIRSISLFRRVMDYNDADNQLILMYYNIAPLNSFKL